MNDKDVIAKIKEHGYWRILFQPLLYKQKLELPACRTVVSNNSVLFRGWDYPHIPQKISGISAIETGKNYCQAWISWEERQHFEFWRMYQSSQFVHYLSLYEDLRTVSIQSLWQQESRDSIPGELLGVVGATYLLTESATFLAKLASSGLYDEGVSVTIGLHNSSGRKLYIDDYRRAPFIYDRKTAAETIEYSCQISKQELIENPPGLALKALIYIFQRFDWDPNIDQLKNDQMNLLSRAG